jgi:ankyrin repeat protein
MPLSRAGYRGHETVVKLLVERDAESMYDSGWTPLSRAVVLGHEEVDQLLISQ